MPGLPVLPRRQSQGEQAGPSCLADRLKVSRPAPSCPAGGSLNNDITVLELAEEVDINTYTPACLAQTSDTDTFNGKTAQVYGWGTTSSGGASSSKLLEVSVPVVTSTQCATSMGPMENGQICAGGEEGKDSCQVTGSYSIYI